MNKNQIFIGVLGAALLVAAVANAISPITHESDGFRVVYSDGSEHKSYRGNGHATLEFNGKHYECNRETGSVVLEHEDGSKTTVTCD